MGAAEITAIIVGVGGILASLFTFITSARNSDVAAVKQLIDQQQDLIEMLQKRLESESDRCQHLEEAIQSRDRVIAQLRSDLGKAQEQISQLQRDQGRRGSRW